MARPTQTIIKRTTISLPPDLVIEVDQAVRTTKARSRNEFVAQALRHMISQINREAIDAEFAGMATDIEYQKEDLAICEEFAASDWEAFRIGEAEAGGLR